MRAKHHILRLMLCWEIMLPVLLVWVHLYEKFRGDVGCRIIVKFISDGFLKYPSTKRGKWSGKLEETLIASNKSMNSIQCFWKLKYFNDQRMLGSGHGSKKSELKFLIIP